MKRDRFLAVQITIFCVFAFYGCATFQPQPIGDIPFKERSQSKIKGDVKVTATVVSAEESRQIFGVDLASKDIQPVWVRVQNADKIPYWLTSTGIDPNYFSPLEAAYAFHRAFASDTNRRIDQHFRVLAFQNPIAPGTTVSGFVFVNRDEDMKVVDVDLLSYKKAKLFTFFILIPGIRADYHEVDFDRLYSENEFVNFDDDDSFKKALEDLACCTTNEDGTRNGDPLNLIFIADRENIVSSFVRRGWLPAEQTYGKSMWKTVKSFLFGTRYRYSPVSPLFLYSRQQDFAAQKPRHTIHQRNHLRVWLSPMRYKSEDVWVGQISRDIGVRLTLKTWPPVTHKIDPDVDEAMYALLEDSIYSQQVRKVGWIKTDTAVNRPKSMENLTGDPYFTAGYRLVLVFDDRPHSIQEIESFGWESPTSMRLKRLEAILQQGFEMQR